MKEQDFDAAIVLLMIACAFFLVGLLACSRYSRSTDKYSVTLDQEKAVVRLHDMETGRFFCSATIISDTLAITARHCVIRQGPLGLYTVINVDVRSYEQRLQVGTRATVISADSHTDYALLMGDFKAFNKMKVISSTMEIYNAVKNDHLIVCGYPAGGELICIPLKNARFSDFKVIGDSFLYPGMSGGPCIDLDKNVIVGTNFGVDKEESFINPLIEMWTVLGVTQR